jgi:hypothetical protein
MEWEREFESHPKHPHRNLPSHIARTAVVTVNTGKSTLRKLHVIVEYSGLDWRQRNRNQESSVFYVVEDYNTKLAGTRCRRIILKLALG